MNEAGSRCTNYILSEPATFSEQARLETAIQETLTNLELRNRQTKEHERVIRRLATKTNLFNSKTTTLYILQMKGENKEILSNGYKKRYLNTYGIFCEANQIPYDKPKLHYEPPIPLIPTTENVNAIINSASHKYTIIFKIMSEIAVEPEELHKTHITQIDKEQGTISIIGTKGHANATYKLKPQTAEMLRLYLAGHTKEYPFPTSRTIGQAWRRTRTRTALKLCKPDINFVPLKNLRNYAGTIFYKTHGHEPIATMRFMRHKCLETTLHYIRAINLDEPEEYTTRAIQLGIPDTQKQIIELLDAGYTYITDADGYKYFRKRK